MMFGRPVNATMAAMLIHVVVAAAFRSKQEVLALPFAHVSTFFTVSLLHESTHTGQLKKESPVDLGHRHWVQLRNRALPNKLEFNHNRLNKVNE